MTEGAAGIMATTTKTRGGAKSSRYTELKKMLEDRRRELMNEVQGRIRDVRAGEYVSEARQQAASNARGVLSDQRS